MEDRVYFCIDMKTFYASVECAERGLNPFETNLAVTDLSRGKNALCLAVSPKLKAQGVRNRCRISEIPGSIKYIAAPPRMQLYIEYAADIYSIYLDYFDPRDIHVYSIDESFIDATRYLGVYGMTPRELAKRLMDEIAERLHIPSTAGIGTNLYLAKIALDITAKHTKDHVGYLTEELYRATLWDHQPITDFWHVAKGTQARLEHNGMRTMRDVANADPELLYRLFGVDAELLIDHAWGREGCTMQNLKSYHSKTHSISNSQILFEDYAYDDAMVVMLEMVEFLSLKLVDTQTLCKSVSLFVRYSKDCRLPTGGARKLPQATDSYQILEKFFLDLYKQSTYLNTPIRQIAVSANNVVSLTGAEQTLFSVYNIDEEQDRDIQQAMLDIKGKYGKNAILRGISYHKKSTGKIRNQLIGGHNGG